MHDGSPIPNATTPLADQSCGPVRLGDIADSVVASLPARRAAWLARRYRVTSSVAPFVAELALGEVHS
jgi:hypothetical protein